jgi:hypothetical protein
MTTKSEELERIALVDGKSVRGFWAVFNVIGGVSGMISLMLVALVGGQYMKQIDINTKDLAEIKMQGSPNLKSVEKSLLNEIDLRRANDEANSRRLDDLRVDFSQRIGNITGLLERLVEQQTKLISLIEVQQQIRKP